jgi:hypothetical protein
MSSGGVKQIPFCTCIFGSPDWISLTVYHVWKTTLPLTGDLVVDSELVYPLHASRSYTQRYGSRISAIRRQSVPQLHVFPLRTLLEFVEQYVP